MYRRFDNFSFYVGDENAWMRIRDDDNIPRFFTEIRYQEIETDG